MKSLNPRIIRRKDGSALLTGLSYSDLCHILTLASIRQHDSEKEHRERREPEAAAAIARYRVEDGPDAIMAEVVEDNLREERIFHRRIRATLDMLNARTSPRYTGDDGPLRALPRWQAMRRLERVRSDRRFRHAMAEMIADAVANRTKATV
ncbi:hypothetical protein HNR00_003519 [Methylorubrum rhodinum]|uniref:Uncharacterized protein n=1 Tax=Methylorubrum rhodinum TaxID=29428 RepID=A0A840ZL10_9HYPH|nr:hypothetical protein [Methylorubrum rhodinum]MBB5758792.1 hypothetical protein [Methylorubrum rhodinum]